MTSETQRHFLDFINLLSSNLNEPSPSLTEYLNSSIHLAPYLEKKFRKIYEGEAYKFYRQR